MHRCLILAGFVAAVLVPFITGDAGSCRKFREWQCRDGTCIPSESKCDGSFDCSDKSDETHAACRLMQCQSNWFRCTYGACVEQTAPCNGVKDCVDNSDELLPQCRNVTEVFSHEFTCDDGGVISATSRCDGAEDCADGSDETVATCGRNICPSYYFQCAYGACVDRGADCDGKIDCADASDEDDVLCNRTQPHTQITRIRTSNSSKKCQLPPYPEHGSYVMNGVAASPGLSVGDGQVNFTCDHGYRLVGGSKVLCFDGEWQSDFPKCGKFCRVVEPPNVKYRCVLSGDSQGTRKCEEYEPEGTQVKHSCAVNYRAEEVDHGYMQCTSDGWNYVPRCERDCGTVTAAGTPMVIHGKTAKRGELPWHVGIYEKSIKKVIKIIKHEQICGGSLISTTLVLSAAHCFWHDRTLLPASNFDVAVGKLYRKWNDSRDDAQYSKVKEIHVPDEFDGAISSYQADIAILVLNKAVQYQIHVKPVCLDFGKDFSNKQLHSGNLGKVAGWGRVASNGGASPELQVVKLPYVDRIACKNNSSEEFIPYITADKFCAGYGNDTALCQGDSGGGLVFLKSGTDRYFLRGIVSTAHQSKDQCDSKSLTTFTNTMGYEGFIKTYWHGYDS